MYTGSFLKNRNQFDMLIFSKNNCDSSGTIENSIPKISDVNRVRSHIVALLDDNLSFKELGDVDQDGQDQNWDGVG